MFASFVSDANTTVRPLQLDDVFELEFAADPQPSPSGEHIVFVRAWMDREQDRRRSSLWMMNSDGSNLQALTDRNVNASSPRWSPTGDRIAFLANGQIQMLWLDSGRTAQVTTLQQGAGSIEWSPDGNWLAFSMFTPKAKPAPVSLPGKPAQAEWAAPPIYIDDMNYRADGRGFLASGYSQIYLVSAQGGSAIQLTEGDFNHGGALSWQQDGKALFFSANRYSDWQSQ